MTRITRLSFSSPRLLIRFFTRLGYYRDEVKTPPVDPAAPQNPCPKLAGLPMAGRHYKDHCTLRIFASMVWLLEITRGQLPRPSLNFPEAL